MSECDYVLITTAYNEGAFIGATIDAVLSQTVLPQKWVIVNDGSSDNTDAIIKRHAEKCSFIECLHREKTGSPHGFISKVSAINMGYEALSDVSYRFIGILDADITFRRDYYERVIGKMREDMSRGITGGFIHERRGDVFRNRPSNTTASVAGAIQFFRRECYETIGGHMPALYGGEDWICEILARKNGWTVRAFPDIVAYHHKPAGGGRGALRDAIRQGKMDYAVGSHPLFELVKCIRRLPESPFFLRALFRLVGYLWSAVKGDGLTVSSEIAEYLRCEQMSKLMTHIGLQRR